jgi:hypothetical protein
MTNASATKPRNQGQNHGHGDGFDRLASHRLKGRDFVPARFFVSRSVSNAVHIERLCWEENGSLAGGSNNFLLFVVSRPQYLNGCTLRESPLP